jgi:ribosomal protein S18 acetylase RimI-like enzyme
MFTYSGDKTMITQRCYKDENDKLAMAELARQFSQDNLRIIDLPYRLSSWALDEPLNACLWEDKYGQLVAWAVLQTPFWTLDCALHPEHARLFPELLAWADCRARELLGTPYGLCSWYVNVFSDQNERIEQLEQAGYTCQADMGEDSWSKVWMKRPGNLPVNDYRVPPGFTVRTLSGKNEAAAYVGLHQAVFETKNMSLEWRKRTLRHPDYMSDLDVIITAPDGRLAAFCIGWLCRGQADKGRFYAQVEPLGCHADYRRYALGRVALAEVLRRMQRHAVKNIYVETDSYRDTAFRLYESMGFEVIRDVLIYCKDCA